MLEPYKASPALEAWILRAAPAFYEVQREVSWAELLSERAGSWRIPVSTRDCEHTIFSSVRVNCAMRALHDHVHLTLDRGFDFESELAVSDVTAHLARAARLPEDDILALQWDGEGQTRFHRAHGEFPKRQDLWAVVCQWVQPYNNTGYDTAIRIYLTKGYDNA